MQIDFHHATTYVCARMSGFSHEDADIISYSAQYVDEATNDGIIFFKNGAKYNRISSAHKMLDRRNFEEMNNQMVWVPFHFLPGNGGEDAGDNPQGSFIHKLICRPDSYISRELLEDCRNNKHKPYALHRLGITMHVYADTFAHQGFAGVNHRVNEVKDLVLYNEEIDFGRKLGDFFGDAWDGVTQKFISKSFPLGHGAALTCPDKPYLKWSYTNGLGEKVERDNLEIFMTAVQTMIGEMILFRIDGTDEAFDFNPADLEVLKKNFETFKEEKGHQRYERWVESLANGDFSFGPVQLSFIPKGEGSWKDKAIANKKPIDDGTEVYDFTSEFLQSDWKMFHDALHAHYFSVVKDILPRYGICAA